MASESTELPQLTDLFKIDKKLGEGSHAKVYRAHTKRTLRGVKPNTQVAIKVLDLDSFPVEEKLFQERFERKIAPEIAVLKRISSYGQKCSPVIVCYYDDMKAIFKGEEVYVIVMEYVKGHDFVSIEEDIRNRSQEDDYEPTNVLDPEQIAYIFVQLLEGLKYMHSLGIVHRDIKPENVIIDKEFSLKYVDMGYACFASLEQIFPKCILEFRGTTEFISPELAALYGDKSRVLSSEEDLELLKAADVWALGALLYEFIYGVTPIEKIYDVYFGPGRSDYDGFFRDLSRIQEIDFPIVSPPLRVFVEIIKPMLTIDFRKRATIKTLVKKVKKM